MEERDVVDIVNKLLEATAPVINNATPAGQDMTKWDARPVMISLPKIVWESLESYARAYPTKSSIEELFQEGILVHLNLDTPRGFADAVMSGIVGIKNK